jgi:hypothetical protein
MSSSDNFIFGATEMLPASPGSFTEEASGVLLKDSGAQFVLIGTSFERRFQEREIPSKIKKAIELTITPFLCIGDSFHEFERRRTVDAVRSQLAESLQGLNESDLSKIQIVYEAPWLAESPFYPSLDLINDTYQTCRETVRETLPSTGVFCPVPKDVPDVAAYVQAIPAEGFYFTKAELIADLKGIQWKTEPAEEDLSEIKDVPFLKPIPKEEESEELE